MIRINITSLMGALLGIIGLAAYSSFYCVPETHQAVRIRSSQFSTEQLKAVAQHNIQKPGIYFKHPLDKVAQWDTRLQHHTVESIPLTITEAGGIRLYFGVTWRIQNANQYLASLKTLKPGFISLLTHQINQYLQSHWQANTLHEALHFSFETMKQDCTQFAQELGIEIVEFNVIQRKPMPNLRQNVIQTMSAHHQDWIKEVLDKGQLQASAIRTQAQIERAMMLANAKTKCANIVSEGSALTMQMYIDAHRKNPKFAFFWKRLISYERSFNTKKPSMIVMQNDAPFLL